ncbi:putative tape measure protein [Acinetobacter phage vB_AbaM_DLP1]|nr:putative tape measure protein [Acinetobacter phage PhaR5]UNI74633.1 baseplate hub subunit tail length determinator [Acinetobacter phage AB-Navy4]UQS94026.1 baseplate hub subunit tail length determinator [Acinetobacter phage AB-Navy1]UYL85969.1 baseplate hub subunit and tail length [Acinetobacter phage vB_AbaM_DP45]WBF78486.1 putative tape measure protein [Acinetobacter phage vB_AbaM_DLP1]WBF78733.1 putative tape measure protein [Acinetobacter phage vB_AbaM_DLP2]
MNNTFSSSKPASEQTTLRRPPKPIAEEAPANDEVFDAGPEGAKEETLSSIDTNTQEQVGIQRQQLGAANLSLGIQDLQNQKLEEISASTSEISSKLSALSDKLKQKYEAAAPVSEAPIQNADSTSEILANKLNAKDSSAQAPEPVKIVPDEKKPSEDLLSKPSEVKGAPDNTASMIVGAVKGVQGAITAGFKKTTSIADKISGMLLKYTVTQAVQAAKLALAVFAIIFAIDMLKIAWQVWGDKIMAKFEEWSQTFGKWWDNFKQWSSYFSDMKNSFEGMKGDLMGIRNAWESGDWPALASAIGTAFIDGIKTLSGMLDRVITKLVATLLDKLGFSKAAKAIEAEGLQNYQNMTNNRLSPENQRKLAEEQIRREEKDGLTPTQRGKTSFLPDSWRKNLGLISADEYNQIQAEKKDQNARRGLSHEDNVKAVAATNEAREAIARFKNIADNVNPNNPAQVAEADKYKKEAQQYINSPGLALVPTVKAELQNQLDSYKPKNNVKASVQPDKSTPSKDTQLVQNIKVAEANKVSRSAAQASTTANINTNIVKTNKSYNVQSPITGTRAPGVFKATSVN